MFANRLEVRRSSICSGKQLFEWHLQYLMCSKLGWTFLLMDFLLGYFSMEYSIGT